MDTLDDSCQSIDVDSCGNVVVWVLVVGADIDDDYVGGWALAKVPWLGVVWNTC